MFLHVWSSPCRCLLLVQMNHLIAPSSTSADPAVTSSCPILLHFLHCRNNFYVRLQACEAPFLFGKNPRLRCKRIGSGRNLPLALSLDTDMRRFILIPCVQEETSGLRAVM